jgi:hypothetical protein
MVLFVLLIRWLVDGCLLAWLIGWLVFPVVVFPVAVSLLEVTMSSPAPRLVEDCVDLGMYHTNGRDREDTSTFIVVSVAGGMGSNTQEKRSRRDIIAVTATPLRVYVMFFHQMSGPFRDDCDVMFLMMLLCEHDDCDAVSSEDLLFRAVPSLLRINNNALVVCHPFRQTSPSYDKWSLLLFNYFLVWSNNASPLMYEERLRLFSEAHHLTMMGLLIISCYY